MNLSTLLSSDIVNIAKPNFAQTAESGNRAASLTFHWVSWCLTNGHRTRPSQPNDTPPPPSLSPPPGATPPRQQTNSNLGIWVDLKRLQRPCRVSKQRTYRRTATTRLGSEAPPIRPCRAHTALILNSLKCNGSRKEPFKTSWGRAAPVFHPRLQKIAIVLSCDSAR